MKHSILEVLCLLVLLRRAPQKPLRPQTTNAMDMVTVVQRNTQIRFGFSSTGIAVESEVSSTAKAGRAATAGASPAAVATAAPCAPCGGGTNAGCEQRRAASAHAAASTTSFRALPWERAMADPRGGREAGAEI